MTAASLAAPNALHRFRRHRLAMVSGGVLVGLCLITLIGPWLAAAFGMDGDAVDLFHRYGPATLAHPLGTDELGRDLLLRLLDGGRISLLVGVAAAVTSSIIGTAIGLLAGYFGGRLDQALMRLTDSVIALPLLPLLIVLAAVDLGKVGIPAALRQSEFIDLLRIIAIVTLVGWTTVARLVRGSALALRERDFVLAARALGAGHGRIMIRHILPNLASPIIVATTLASGQVILLESVLSFLGLGIQPPVASWGNMLTNAQELIWTAPSLAIFPGVLIFATVIAFNFLGDGLRDALDPRTTDKA